MNKIHLDEKIFYVTDVLSEESAAKLYEYACDPEGWGSEGAVDLWENNLKVIKGEELEKIVEELFYATVRAFDNPKKKINKSFVIGRYTTEKSNNPNSYDEDGTEWSMSLHWDGSTGKSEDGIIFYLNDNFDGGEVVYPIKGFEWKPIKNSLLVHSADYDCMHGVRKITSGYRYILNSFTVLDKQRTQEEIDELLLKSIKELDENR